MSYVADLHLHSRYAYATSKELNLENLALWAKIKGIDLLASADFTHPVWFEECRQKLKDTGDGLLEYKGTKFILGTEVDCRGKQGGKSRRVHMLIFAPSFDAVERLNLIFRSHAKLDFDGRPSLDLLPGELLAVVKEIDEQCFLIPAHLWTPWFGLYGAKSGYDSLEECFGDAASEIHAVETGLSSDPAMNWAVPSLDNMSIMSFSDAHSLPNMGRELTALNGELSYNGLVNAMRSEDIAYTIEFYPEEGKYHDSGHRKCGVRLSSIELREKGDLCSSCGRKVTVGVSSRVEELGGRQVTTWVGDDGLIHGEAGRPPFKSLVPLREILSESLGVGVNTKKVRTVYQRLTEQFGNELSVLMNASTSDIALASDERTAEGIAKVRSGDISIEPGYDGLYGVVKVWSDHQSKEASQS